MTHYSATSLEQIADELERLAGGAQAFAMPSGAPAFREAATLVRNTRLTDPAMEAMREALAMCVAEMSRARGRIETIASCNEDRRIAAALGSTCDFVRHTAFSQSEEALAKDNGHV